MADLTITAASVSYTSGPVDGDQVAGEAITTGQICYKKESDGRWYKAQHDGTAEEAGSIGLGLALATAAAAGARISVARPGAIVAIGTGTAGIVYCPSNTAGSLAPTADLGSTDKVTVAALGIGSNSILLGWMYNAGAVLA